MPDFIDTLFPKGLSTPAWGNSQNPGAQQPGSGAGFTEMIIGRNKINQLRGIGINNATGAGIPQHVTNISVSIANAQTGSTSAITVQFRRDPSDVAFSGVTVYV